MKEEGKIIFINDLLIIIHYFSDKNRDSTAQRRRQPDIKRTLSSNSINNKLIDRQDDDEFPKIKSRIISKDTAITKREQVIAMQSRQNDLERNKRMFGCLLGTLQKFRKEENILKSKEEKKAKIEKKLEEQEMLEKIKLKQEREELLANRKRKQIEVKALETKMSKLRDLQVWEESKKHLTNFIKTNTKPEIFWLPKIMTSKTTSLQNRTNQEITESIEERRRKVDEEIKEIEDQIEKDGESYDDHTNGKKSVSLNDDVKVEPHESENGDDKEENHDRGK